MGRKANFYAFAGILILLSGIIFSTSCKRDTITTASGEELSRKNLERDITQYRDSMNAVWQEMIEDDDQKIADIKRLLKEIRYTEDYNEALLNEFQQEADRLQEIRFTQKGMTSPEIDAYDTATDTLLSDLYAYTESLSEGDDHPLVGELVSDIKEADSDVVIYRVRYDRWAFDYNDILSKYGEELGKPYKTWEEVPVFMIPEEEQ